MKGLGLWCLSPLTTIFQSVLLVEETGVPQWSKQDYTKKTTDLPQIPNKLYRIMLYRVHLAWEEFELTTLVVDFEKPIIYLINRQKIVCGNGIYKNK
jgi:hypothetical protein